MIFLLHSTYFVIFLLHAAYFMMFLLHAIHILGRGGRYWLTSTQWSGEPKEEIWSGTLSNVITWLGSKVQAKPDFITTWDCLLRVARNVGGGGGHKLTVKNFKMTLLHKSPLDWIILCYILCFWYIIGPKFDNSCRVSGHRTWVDIFCNVPFAHDLYLFVH